MLQISNQTVSILYTLYLLTSIASQYIIVHYYVSDEIIVNINLYTRLKSEIVLYKWH